MVLLVLSNCRAVAACYLLNRPLAWPQMRQMREGLADEFAGDRLEFVAGHLPGKARTGGFRSQARKNALGNSHAYAVIAVGVGGNAVLIRAEHLFEQRRMKASPG